MTYSGPTPLLPLPPLSTVPLAAIDIKPGLPKRNHQVAQLAHAAGVPVVLDCGGVEGVLLPELLRHVTFLSPNETELARLTGMPTDSLELVEAAAGKLLQQGVPNVLVKLGGDGSVLLAADGTKVRQEIFKAPKVVDTTGAGDCFTASFAVALLRGQPPAAAMRFASAAASICVTRKGAMPSMPELREVEALIAAGGDAAA